MPPQTLEGGAELAAKTYTSSTDLFLVTRPAAHFGNNCLYSAKTRLIEIRLLSGVLSLRPEYSHQQQSLDHAVNLKYQMLRRGVLQKSTQM